MGVATYFASKSRHAPMVAALLACGLPLCSTWHSWQANASHEEPSDDEWRIHSQRCLDEASRANICLLYFESNERHMGSLLEAGACIAGGGWVYLVADKPPPFLANHPRCRVFDRLSDACRAIIAQRDAAQARVAA